MARKAKEEAEHAVEEAEKEAEQAKQRAVAKKAKEAKRLADELYESQQKLMQVRGAFAVACPLLPRSLSPNGHLLSCSLPPSPFHHPLASTLLPFMQANLALNAGGAPVLLDRFVENNPAGL